MNLKHIEDQAVSEVQMDQRTERMIVIGRAAALLELVSINAARLSDNHNKVIQEFLELVNKLMYEKFDNPQQINDLIHELWTTDDIHSTISSQFYNPETPLEFSDFKRQKEFLN